ncbi:MAG: HPr family phosphocarrier protein [Oscillospiraceae bacterium]|nr:HPr family phosphocarrier protein [Oscillospiraceae bacterium]
MRTFMYTITVPVGMHARHAGLLVREAQKYQSDIRFSLGEHTVDGKRIMAVMTLAAKQGDLIKTEVEGPDEDLAATQLKGVFFEHF